LAESLENVGQSQVQISAETVVLAQINQTAQQRADPIKGRMAE
jgi:hypothetical protein